MTGTARYSPSAAAKLVERLLESRQIHDDVVRPRASDQAVSECQATPALHLRCRRWPLVLGRPVELRQLDQACGVFDRRHHEESAPHLGPGAWVRRPISGATRVVGDCAGADLEEGPPPVELGLKRPPVPGRCTAGGEHRGEAVHGAQGGTTRHRVPPRTMGPRWDWERGKEAALEHHRRRWPYEKQKLKFIVVTSVVLFLVMWLLGTFGWIK